MNENDILRERIEYKLMVVSQLINMFVQSLIEETDVRLISAEVLRQKYNDSVVMLISADELIDSAICLLNEQQDRHT